MSDARIDSAIVSEQQVWSSPESQAYYRQHRNTPDELYRSERFFLPETVRAVGSMLDVGCAAGGFSAVVKTFNPGIRYVGVDVAPAFVDQARAAYPGSEFLVGDGVHFTTPPGSFELVHASGVLHLNRRYRDIVSAMWDQTNRYLLCDLRLTDGTGEIGRMESPFGEPQAVSLPYIVLNVNEAVEMFRALSPAPTCIRVKGYQHRAARTATLTAPDIMMAFFLVEKGPGGGPPSFDVEIDGR